MSPGRSGPCGPAGPARQAGRAHRAGVGASGRAHNRGCHLPGTMPIRSHTLTLLASAWVAATLAACAAPALDWPPDRPLVLLGEVHDNAEGHRLRLRAFDELLARGARPALVMEQFDRQDQPATATALARRPAPTASALVAEVLAARSGAAGKGPAMGGSGWTWSYYEPFIERALRYGLPIVAANVGRDEARRVMREGLAAHGFDAAVPADILAGLAGEVEASHCGQVDDALARRMALAQVARDQQMARAVVAHASRGAVLLAGNGHVRTDLGVPRWLPAEQRARSLAVGVLEQGTTATAFDRRLFVPEQPRPDPCAGMKPPNG
jgi:uncharacterized iron-regulated protein